MIDEHVEVGSVVDQVELGSEAPANASTGAEHAPEKKREWFIRGMPSDLIEQVKTSAKAGRMTLAEWLTEKLGHILAEETGVLDDGARITKLEKEVEDAHQRIDSLCEVINSKREGERKLTAVEQTRERYRQLTEGRR